MQFLNACWKAFWRTFSCFSKVLVYRLKAINYLQISPLSPSVIPRCFLTDVQIPSNASRNVLLQLFRLIKRKNTAALMVSFNYNNSCGVVLKCTSACSSVRVQYVSQLTATPVTTQFILTPVCTGSTTYATLIDI